MTSAPTNERSLDELMMGSSLALEQLVERKALAEMAASFHGLFGVPLRVFSEVGVLLADASEQPALYEYLNQHHRRARTAIQEVVAAVKRVDVGPKGEGSYSCFTGAVYHIVAIRYDDRSLGRLVLGPFLPPGVKDIPETLVDVEPELDRERVRELLFRLPRAREETVKQIGRHLRGTLDLILFSGHKALLTSGMHLASVRESFRDLEDKNARLQEAYDRLKELDRLKSNFLATVSHELRTPLTSIIGYSEMLVEGIAGEMSVEQREFVRTIHEKGEQLLELITSLLDLSKLESGTLAMRKSDVTVEHVVSDVVHTVSPAARKKAVNVTSTVESGLPKLWADPTRLRQVVLNLVDNAMKLRRKAERSASGSARPRWRWSPTTRKEGWSFCARSSPPSRFEWRTPASEFPILKSRRSSTRFIRWTREPPVRSAAPGSASRSSSDWSKDTTGACGSKTTSLRGPCSS
jgi:hypothetical protein